MDSPRSTAATPMRERKWTSAGKAVARRAFDLALSRELDAVIREAKGRAARISHSRLISYACDMPPAWSFHHL